MAIPVMLCLFVCVGGLTSFFFAVRCRPQRALGLSGQNLECWFAGRRLLKLGGGLGFRVTFNVDAYSCESKMGGNGKLDTVLILSVVLQCANLQV